MSEIPVDPTVKARVMSAGQIAEREALNRAITSESLRKRALQLANGRARELGLRTEEEVRRSLAIPPPCFEGYDAL